MKNLVIFGLLVMTSPAWAQAGTPAGAPAIAIQDQRLAINLDGDKLNLAARIFRPPGSGPFPVVVINHGTPINSREAHAMKLGYNMAANWFASQGFAVVVALRPGFGDSDGSYVEGPVRCETRNYARDGREMAVIEAAIVTSAASLPGIDSKRIIVVGHSAGGYGAIALADNPPPGVIAVINFAGGRGGDAHEHICGGDRRLVDGTGELGRSNQVRQLWLYAANDHFFRPELAHAMFAAYQAGSRAPVQFFDLPPFGDDGHGTFGSADPSVWASPVSMFLQTVIKASP